MDFVRSNRTWLTTPPLEIGEDPNPITEPIRLRGYRVNVPSKLWSPFSHLWKLTVPVNKARGSAKFPLVFEGQDASVDEAGKLLTPKTFAELGKSGEANFNIRMEVIGSDKTYKAEMTFLKKLPAPHTMPEDDQPSVASLLLLGDVVKVALRDNKPLKEFMPDLELLRPGTHDNKDLHRFHERLSVDQHNSVSLCCTQSEGTWNMRPRTCARGTSTTQCCASCDKEPTDRFLWRETAAVDMTDEQGAGVYDDSNQANVTDYNFFLSARRNL